MLNFSFTTMAHAETTVKIKEFPLLGTHISPQGITRGPDNALWFTELSGNKIGRINLHGQVSEFPILTSGGAPVGIIMGPDDALWFTKIQSGKIGLITTWAMLLSLYFPQQTHNQFISPASLKTHCGSPRHRLTRLDA